MAKATAVRNVKPGDTIETTNGMCLVLGAQTQRWADNAKAFRVDITVQDVTSTCGYTVLNYDPKAKVMCDPTYDGKVIIDAVKLRVELVGK